MKHHLSLDSTPLRPTLVLNIVLVVVILGVFGISHTWLGMRHHEKDKEVKRLEDAIMQTQNEIRRLEVDVNHRTSNGTLFNQMEELHIKLELMKPNEAILLGSVDSATKAPGTTEPSTP